ncbi:SDR family oxidoreductase [Gammaproteobacteria bacterium]|jgi:short-subunit dehydrogenase|nr:SDR family oxidoreductase [Gammaproteobacteria bacterium]
MSVVISGATGGVGKALTELYASKGHNLILLGRSERKLKHLIKATQKKYSVEMNYFICDINDEGTMDKLIFDVNKLTENFEILINVAGVFPVGPICEIENVNFDNCMNVNLKLPIMLSKGLFKKLAYKGGKILNIGSSSSYGGFKNTALYCASKHAILGLSRALNDEWKDSGVTVHCISPGTINTEMANVLDQDSTTYIQPNEFAQLVYDVGSYSGNMLVDEVRAVRRVIR